MNTVNVRGIEIVDDACVPDGEIWLLCPIEGGGKVRYMFNLVDYRMTMPGQDLSFFQELQCRLETLRRNLAMDDMDDANQAQLDLILEAMDDFRTGNSVGHRI